MNQARQIKALWHKNLESALDSQEIFNMYAAECAAYTETYTAAIALGGQPVEGSGRLQMPDGSLVALYPSWCEEVQPEPQSPKTDDQASELLGAWLANEF